MALGDSPVIVPAGEYHPGDIVCIGGSVLVRGEVRGSIVVIGGVLTLSGTARSDVVAVASRVDLEDGAFIRGTFLNVAGPVHRGDNVIVRGQYTSIDFVDLGRFATGHGALRFLVLLFFWFTILATAVRFLAVLVVAAVASSRIEAALAPPQPSWVLAFFVGLLVHVLAALVSFLLIALCITIPLVPVLAIAVRVATWMGLVAIYLQVGRNASRTVLGRTLSYFGSILTGFLIFAVVGLVPVFGWFFSGIVSSTGLGLMLLTRFGGSRRPAPLPAAVPGPGGVRTAAAPPPARPGQTATPRIAEV